MAQDYNDILVSGSINADTLITMLNALVASIKELKIAAMSGTAFNKTTSTTLSNVTGLTLALESGGKYEIDVYLQITQDATGGGKYAIAYSGTSDYFISQFELVSISGAGSFVAADKQTLLGVACADQSTTTEVALHVRGYISCTSAGNLTVQFAQNVSSGTSSVLFGTLKTIKAN